MSYTPMTAEDRTLIAALGLVRYAPGSWDKRFARDMVARAQEAEAQLSAKQRAALERMRNHYRRQLLRINPLVVADLKVEQPRPAEWRRRKELEKLAAWEQAMKGGE